MTYLFMKKDKLIENNKDFNYYYHITRDKTFSFEDFQKIPDCQKEIIGFTINKLNPIEFSHNTTEYDFLIDAMHKIIYEDLLNYNILMFIIDNNHKIVDSNFK